MFKYKQFEKGKSPRGDLKYMSLEKNNENFDPKFPTHKYAYQRKIIIIIIINNKHRNTRLDLVPCVYVHKGI